jgi:hypothetical protein
MGGERWWQVGLQVQQGCLLSHDAYVCVGEDGSAGEGEMGTFRQSEVLRGGKIVQRVSDRPRPIAMAYINARNAHLAPQGHYLG